MKTFTNRASLLGAATFCAFLVVTPAQAAVLIINGSSGTSEPGTTSAITTNLDTLLQAAGNTTSISNTVPVSFTGFSQIWDIRFDNALAITSAEQTRYLSYLQGGGGLFVMGENDSFTTRNNSVLSLIAAAGGGSLTFAVPPSNQTVISPFTGPNSVSTVTYAAPGGVTSSGTGQFITQAGGGAGTGVAFKKGTLANAPNGVLTTIFDVNFMQGTTDQPNSQNLLKNLIGFQTVQVDPPTIPTPALLPGLIGLGASAWRKRRNAATAKA